MLNSKHLSLVNKIGDKTEFTIMYQSPLYLSTYDLTSYYDLREHSRLMSDVFGSILTYLPTQIGYHQIWLDLLTYLPQDLTSDFKNFTTPMRVHIMDLILLLNCCPRPFIQILFKKDHTIDSQTGISKIQKISFGNDLLI